MQAANRAALANQNYTIEYTFPKEGSLLWFDCWTIPRGAKNKDNAYKWFNYLMKDDVASSVSNEIKYILPVKGAINLLSDNLKNNPNVNLTDEMYSKAYFPQTPTSKVSRITNRIWNSMKLNSSAEDESGWN